MHRKNGVLGNHAYAVSQKIKKVETAYISMMCPLDMSQREVLEMFFTKELLDDNRDSYARLQPKLKIFGSSTTSIPLDIYFRTEVDIKWEMLTTPMWNIPEPDKEVRLTPKFVAWFDGVVEHHEKFMNVRRVVDFLNNNTTLNGFRYYFPAILPLISENCNIFSEVSGARVGFIVGEWVAHIRAAAATIASALLLPPSEPKVATITLDVDQKVDIPIC